MGIDPMNIPRFLDNVDDFTSRFSWLFPQSIQEEPLHPAHFATRNDLRSFITPRLDEERLILGQTACGDLVSVPVTADRPHLGHQLIIGRSQCGKTMNLVTQISKAHLGFWGDGGVSCDQGGNERSEEGFSASAGVVNELEEAEIDGQFLLRDAAGRTQPGAEQRPEALQGIDVNFAETVAIVIAGILTPGMADRVVTIAPVFQAGIDIVFISIDQRARADSLCDDRLDGRLLNVGQHVENDFATALDQSKYWRLLLFQGAATACAFQSPPAP